MQQLTDLGAFLLPPTLVLAAAYLLLALLGHA